MAAGVPQVIFGDRSLLGPGSALADRPDLLWAQSIERLEALVQQLFSDPFGSGLDRWRLRRTGISKRCSNKHWPPGRQARSLSNEIKTIEQQQAQALDQPSSGPRSNHENKFA